MREITPADRYEIVVGRTLRFDIYGADRTLLLASGRIVPNEFVREGLLRTGVYCSGEATPHATRQTGADMEQRVSMPMESLQHDYRNISARAQVGFRMEREGVGAVYTSRVMGTTAEGALLMTTPIANDGTRVTLATGDTWTFRALYALVALRFTATIGQTGVPSEAYFYATDIRNLERRDVRKWPRIPTCLVASREGDAPRLMVDLSVGGARIAADHHSVLQEGQQILINSLFKMLDREYPLTIEATVLNLYGHADPKHPSVTFYGVQFEQITDMQRLMIHAYVQEHLCTELDRVAHVFSLKSA